LSVTKRQYRFLGVDDIRLLIYELAAELPPARRGKSPGFRFNGRQGVRLLESALDAPRQTFQGKYLHRTVFDKTAALFRSLANNHALLEGNKPLALTSAIVFLNLNGYVFHAPHGDSIALVRRATSLGEKPALGEIARWFRRRALRADAFLALPEMEMVAWLDAEGQNVQEARRLLHIYIGQALELVREQKKRADLYQPILRRS
jgi:death-on-curing protein